MDAITGIKPAIVAPTVPVRRSEAPALPKARAAELPIAPRGDVEVPNAQAIEQKRFATVKRIAGDIANANILGQTSFTIYKDVTGQYITRFTDKRTGEVKYIPEPTLIKLSHSDEGPAVTIKA